METQPHVTAQKWHGLECTVSRGTKCHQICVVYVNSSLLCYSCSFKHLNELALVNCSLESGLPLRRKYTEDALCQRHGMKWNFRYVWDEVVKLYLK